MSKKVLTSLIKELFIEGKNTAEICEIAGISRPTFYAHKKRDELKQGISWEELALSANRTTESLTTKEAIFLNSLFRSFDRFLKKAENDELSDETLERLHIYARTYYNLKAPKNLNEKEIIQKATGETIIKIRELALKNKNEAVAKFLSEFSDEIISEILKGVK